MRLTELDPRWAVFASMSPGCKQGLTFLCPHCKAIRLGVFFDQPICGCKPVDLDFYQKSQRDVDSPLHSPELHDVHMGRVLWHREGDSFENLTLTPSVDASAFGHWHGFITGGEIS